MSRTAESTHKTRTKNRSHHKSGKSCQEDIANDAAIGAYVARARSLKDAGEFDAAVRLFKHAVDQAPDNPALRFELGKMHTDKRLFDYGAAELEMALSIDPEFTPALIELAQSYILNDHLNKADPLIEEALSRKPHDPGLNIVYGLLEQKRTSLPKAIEHFRHGLELRLNQPTVDKTPPQKSSFGDEQVEQCLWDTLSQLARAGVHAFACYGTLLGLIRDGQLMPFDKDIDFGLPHSEMGAARLCLEENGWLKVPMMSFSNPVSFVHPVRGLTVDLSGFVIDPNRDGGAYTGFWLDDAPMDWNRHTYYPPLTLEKTRSPDDQPIWMLSNPQDWLLAIYGDQWRVPDSTFDTVIAAKNLCSFSLLTQCYAFSRIYKYWHNGNLAKASALINHTLAHLPDDELLHRIRHQVCGDAEAQQITST